MSDRIIQAAAQLTTSTSSLLGTKSIGVDYGLVRTGIAVSNGYNPQPLSIESKLAGSSLSIIPDDVCAAFSRQNKVFPSIVVEVRNANL